VVESWASGAWRDIPAAAWVVAVESFAVAWAVAVESFAVAWAVAGAVAVP